MTTSGDAVQPAWSPDSRNLVLRGPEGVAIYDTVAGTSRTILAASDFSALSSTRDGDALVIQNEPLDSEIWLLEFE